MRKKLHSLIGLGLAVSVLGSIAVGCGNKNNGTTAQTEAEKPSKITFGISIGLTEEDGRADVEAKFKDLTGVELEIVAPPHNQYYEKLDTSFSSGTAPDVVYLGDNTLPKYASMNALVKLDDFIANSSVADTINKQSLDAIKLKGSVYGIPTESGNGTITYIRQDWLDQLNLKAPKNYDEFYNMLKAFKEIKAPNNASTIPLTSAGLTGYTYLIEFYQDARPEFIKKNGKWVDGFTEPEMQIALQRLADAYKDGLLDQEIFTNKTSDSRDKFYAGRVGVFNYWAGVWANTLNTRLQQGPAGKDASIVGIEPIEGVKYVTRTPATIAMNASAKNQAGIWEYFFETFLDGAEGSRLFSAGVEGIHYEVKDASKNTVVGLPMKSNASNKYSKSYFEDYMYTVPVKYTFEYANIVETTRETLMDNMLMDDLIPISSTRNKKAGDISSLREQLIAQVVKGEKTVTQAMSEYKAKASENEIAKILEELNKN